MSLELPLQGPIAKAQKRLFTLHSAGKSGKTLTWRVGTGWFLYGAAGSRIGLVSKNGVTTGFSAYIGFIPTQGIGVFGVANAKGLTPGGAGAKVLRTGSTSGSTSASAPGDRG